MAAPPVQAAELEGEQNEDGRDVVKQGQSGLEKGETQRCAENREQGE
jgi:hypothetical protein